MDFVNQTKGKANWTMGLDHDGRELFVVAVKATFTIPPVGEEAELAEEQAELVESDEFTGEPGLSAPVRESDYAHRKPMCDVILNGSAYALRGERTSEVSVGLRAGRMVKAFAVVGDRIWRKGVVGMSPTNPVPFDIKPISYDSAFGGVDDSTGDPLKLRTYLQNPVGRGYRHSKETAEGLPLPNTEELETRVLDTAGPYRPMAFGSIGRNWLPRMNYAGTYDQEWLDTRAPFWPDDFDDRYFQAAPPDQQIPYPIGAEQIVLKNLTPDGHAAFRLPVQPMPVWFLPHRGRDVRVDSVLDTIVIEPDRGVFTLTWRAAQPMRRSAFDIKQIIAGEMSAAWQRARKYGNKPYYKGLAELAQARRRK